MLKRHSFRTCIFLCAGCCSVGQSAGQSSSTKIMVPAVGSFYSIVDILRHMNKNVKVVPKIIQNTLKRLNRCISNDSAARPNCISMFFRSVFYYFNRHFLPFVCIFILVSLYLCCFAWVSCIILHNLCIF